MTTLFNFLLGGLFLWFSISEARYGIMFILESPATD